MEKVLEGVTKLADIRDEFNFVKKIGDGGFGSVYTVTLRKKSIFDGQYFALKHVKIDVKQLKDKAPVEMESALREFKVLHSRKMVCAKGLVCMYTVFWTQTHPNVIDFWFLMDLYQGNVIDFKKTRKDFQPAGMLLQIAQAIKRLHDHDIVHRDIKPDNVLYSGDTFVVGDFGLLCTTVKECAGVAGTTFYMAPEVRGDKDDTVATKASDIYSLGVTFIEILMLGNTQDDDMMDRFHAGYQAEPRWEMYRDLLSRMVSADAQQRPTIDDVIRALETPRQSTPSSSSSLRSILRENSMIRRRYQSALSKIYFPPQRM